VSVNLERCAVCGATYDDRLSHACTPLYNVVFVVITGSYGETDDPEVFYRTREEAEAALVQKREEAREPTLRLARLNREAAAAALAADMSYEYARHAETAKRHEQELAEPNAWTEGRWGHVVELKVWAGAPKRSS